MSGPQPNRDPWAELDAEAEPEEDLAEPTVTIAEAEANYRKALSLQSKKADGIARDGRPRLNVGNPAVAAERLREEVGNGPLAGMFLRGDQLVHLPRIGEEGYVEPDDGEDSGPAQVRAMTVPMFKARVEVRYSVCVGKMVDDPKTSKKKKVFEKRLLPRAVAEHVVESAGDGTPSLRTLRGVTHTPAIRPDGTVLDRPGYDSATGLAFLPDVGAMFPEIPEIPTARQIEEAVSLIRFMVSDFPWKTKHDEANFFGLLFTPVLRPLVPPAYQLGCIGAPMRGSGKTLLATLLRIIHGGVFRSEMPADEAELGKFITATLLTTTSPVVHIDNVSGILRSPKLAGLLTSDTWTDRQLGVNRNVTLPNDRLWVVTGNNLQVGGDIGRRTLWVTIDPDRPAPELRDGFKIPDLESWAQHNRGAVIAALLTIARGWVLDGQSVESHRSDSFANWAASMRGLLQWAGVPGVFGDSESAREPEGADDDEWATFLQAVRREFADESFSAAEVLSKVRTEMYVNEVEHTIALDELPGELADKQARSPATAPRSLGKWLGNREGRWAGGLAVRKLDRHKSRGTLFRVIESPSAGQDHR